MALLATFPRLSSEWLKHETDPTLGREEIVVASGAGNLITGTVLGKISKGAVTAAAKSGGNTGNGALTMDGTTPKLAGAKVGVYKVRCIEVTANSGLFQVVDPNGAVIGHYVVGAAAFATEVKFTIADGATDFAQGDGFDITIAAGSGKWKKHVSGAVDGTEVAAGILLDGVDATSADVKAVRVKADALVAPLFLTWDSSVDDDTKKAAALAQLAAANIQQTRTY